MNLFVLYALPQQVHKVDADVYNMVLNVQEVHCLGLINRDVRPENMLLDETTGVLYLVDWGSATKLSETPLHFEGTVHYSAARILDQVAVNSTAVTWASADDLESLVCSAFCLCHPDLQAQLHKISKTQVQQIQEWWQCTAWQQRACWQKAVEFARCTDYKEVALRLQELMQ